MPINKWTKKLADEFNALAIKEALETISKKEMKRLEHLSRLRDRLLPAMNKRATKARMENFQRIDATMDKLLSIVESQ